MQDNITGVPASFLELCQSANVTLAPETLSSLERYVALLLQQNRKFNLTSITDPDGVWRRHIMESLILQNWLGGAKKAVDIGSGAGIPGIPLAIAQSQLAMTLVEVTQKKASFLRLVANSLNLANVEVQAERSETLARLPQHREVYDVALAKTVGPLSEVIELALPFLQVGGRLLAVKGSSVQQEIAAAGRSLAELKGEIEAVEPLKVSEHLVVVVVKKIAPTVFAYPRNPGVPHSSPL